MVVPSDYLSSQARPFLPTVPPPSRGGESEKSNGLFQRRTTDLKANVEKVLTVNLTVDFQELLKDAARAARVHGRRRRFIENEQPTLHNIRIVSPLPWNF